MWGSAGLCPYLCTPLEGRERWQEWRAGQKPWSPPYHQNAQAELYVACGRLWQDARRVWEKSLYIQNPKTPLPSRSHHQSSTVYLEEVVREERGTSWECFLLQMHWHSCTHCLWTGSCGTHSTVHLGRGREAPAGVALV